LIITTPYRKYVKPESGIGEQEDGVIEIDSLIIKTLSPTLVGFFVCGMMGRFHYG